MARISSPVRAALILPWYIPDDLYTYVFLSEMNHFDRCTLLGSYHLPKMFEKIMFYCFQEGQKGSN